METKLWAGRWHMGTPVEGSLLELASIAASPRCAHPRPRSGLASAIPASRPKYY